MSAICPVYPKQQTFPGPVGTSHLCPEPDVATYIDTVGGCHDARRPHPLSAARLDLRLLQPEPHTHLAVHGGRRRGVFLRLLARARASAELAEAEVAVGDERAHAERVG